ncbi:hypothetical protein DF141_13855 [Burkholderia cenocepacia]|nr:hypothetical protein DF147_27975 [Burkholderia cenocepacia]RQU75623.1 hypothetical protein DF141_13855 [Burkholderia cenocepacia]RQU88538.1 hypothetical protein DF133_17465 [Burkholderia cenocepacia]RQV17022.1 hypothetical protein DF039_17410 [Burkholderia cenocepacia]RQV17122.1 hypothetical protein DF132_25120 [Burkholderia cenocepacia]
MMNLDAFFAFSAMRVRFVQVTGRAFRDERPKRYRWFTYGHAHRQCVCRTFACGFSRIRCSAATARCPDNAWS